MRIAYYSDTHIEHRMHVSIIPWCSTFPLALGPNLKNIRELSPDFLILAGDIGCGPSDGDTSTFLYAKQVSQYLGCRVIVVPGNHEYYSQDFYEFREQLLSINTDEVIFLDRENIIIEKDNQSVRILGTTLWTNYSLYGNQAESMAWANKYMNDQRRINVVGEGKFTAYLSYSEHNKSIKWLSSSIIEPFSGKTIIASHHRPHPTMNNPNYQTGMSTSCFASDLSGLIKLASNSNCVAWISGHSHYCYDGELYGVKLLSCEVGYPGEETGFKEVKFIDI